MAQYLSLRLMCYCAIKIKLTKFYEFFYYQIGFMKNSKSRQNDMKNRKISKRVGKV